MLRKTVATLLTKELGVDYAAKYLGHGHGTAVLYSHYVQFVNEVDGSGSSALNHLMPPKELSA
jgi:hypothetical protein